MRSAMAALQSPSVGRAARLEVMQGHRKLQLQVSMYSPSICQSAMVSILRGNAARRPDPGFAAAAAA